MFSETVLDSYPTMTSIIQDTAGHWIYIFINSLLMISIVILIIIMFIGTTYDFYCTIIYIY